MDRGEIVTRLVAGSPLTSQERRLIGAFVTRVEVRAVITKLLERHGRFPLDAEGAGGLELVIVPEGVRVVTRRISSNGSSEPMPADAAIEYYIDRELGPICHGIQIRR